ncbi:hypothetical protein ACFRAE_07130 [Sphingobacterium sp. HJSM2_6]|uniref:hypothetical protein n=1 Tax=Sphingobacterium sp. HJSM2_6 TaxID=3366264 RepID=UPI003BDCE3C7
MKNEEFDKLFADKFQDSATEVPDHIWQDIHAQLDGEAPKTRKFSVYWKFTAIAASIVVLFSIAFHQYLFQSTELAIHETDPVGLALEKQENSRLPEKPLIEENKPSSQLEKPVIPVQMVKKEAIKNSLAVNLNKKPNKQMADAALTSKKSVENKLLAPSKPLLAKMELMHSNTVLSYSEKLPELSLAASKTVKLDKPKSSLIVSLLNTVSDKLNIIEKDIHFSNDEEGTLLITLSK